MDVKEHTPQSMKSKEPEIEKLDSGCCDSSCSFSCSLEDENDYRSNPFLKNNPFASYTEESDEKTREMLKQGFDFYEENIQRLYDADRRKSATAS